jgi:hypothetical protein
MTDAVTEYVAQAIYTARKANHPAVGYPSVEGPWEQLHPDIKERYMREARAAMSACADVIEVNGFRMAAASLTRELRS